MLDQERPRARREGRGRVHERGQANRWKVIVVTRAVEQSVI